MQSKKYINLSFFLIIASSLLAGCSNDDSSESRTTNTPNTTNDKTFVIKHNVVVATRSSDYSSGAHSVISISDDANSANNELSSSGSDVYVVTYGKNIFRLGKFGLNHITKYSIDSPSTAIWQYSTQDDTKTSSNPYDMAFVNESKAYVLRYGSDKIWIVNPSATKEADFKMGEIDLAAYADSDGVPEMSKALIIDDKLYVLMQRLVDYSPSAEVAPYLAVFDTTTDTEIDTTNIDTPLKGIALSVKNPSNMEYLSSNNTIYVSAVGKYAVTWTDPVQAAEYTGGIESINVSNYTTKLILDDGDADTHPYGQISNIAVLNSTRGYFHGYIDGFSDNLYEFNPTTGAVVDTPILKNLSIADIEIDRSGNLWIGDATNHALLLMDTVNNTFTDDPIDTVLYPINISFITSETHYFN